MLELETRLLIVLLLSSRMLILLLNTYTVIAHCLLAISSTLTSTSSSYRTGLLVDRTRIVIKPVFSLTYAYFPSGVFLPLFSLL